jgi:hypothetical protein
MDVSTTSKPADKPSPRKKSAFLQLVHDLARKSECHQGLLRWLGKSSVEDLQMAYPMLLNWSIQQMQAVTISCKYDNGNTKAGVVGVVKRIVNTLRYAATQVNTGTGSMCFKTSLCLRMSLSGYLHANKAIMCELPILQDLVQEDEPLFNLWNESLAANTMSMLTDDNRLLPGDACQNYIQQYIPIAHRFTGEIVSKMEVLKVFDTSRTKPAWIRCYGDFEHQQPLKPDFIAKKGDDLRNDEAIRFIAKLCNHLWAAAPVDWKLGRPPSVFCYDVVVTSPDSGYLQHVLGKTFFELSQKIETEEAKEENSLVTHDTASNMSKIGWDDVNIDKLAPSLVGSYVTHFVLGTRDRHEHNMMVIGEMQRDPQLMQIDFGYVLMEYPGGVRFDTPRLTMPIHLIDRLNQVDDRDDMDDSSLMDRLQQDMVSAFLVLRKHAEELIRFSKIMLSTSHDPAAVEAFFRGNHSLRTNDTESESANHFARKVEMQLSRFVLRREVRQRMVASYYNFYRGVEFSKNLQTRSKRRFLARRAAEARRIPLQSREPEKRKSCHRTNLSARDMPSNCHMITSRDDKYRKDPIDWFDAMQGSATLFESSFSNEEDCDDQCSTPSELDFV